MRVLSCAAMGLMAGVLIFHVSPSHAMVYTLTLSDPGKSIGTEPFGTNSVTQDAGGKSLDIVETLSAGVEFAKNNNDSHNALTFSLKGNPTVTITDLTTGFVVAGGEYDSGTWTVDKANIPETPLGKFDYAIDTDKKAPGPLSFTVTSTSKKGLTIDSLEFNDYVLDGITYQVQFASDLVDDGKGNVGALTVTAAVPEPSTWAMMLLGFVGVSFAGYRRRKSLQLAQSRLRTDFTFRGNC
jgi:hypothetical protein